MSARPNPTQHNLGDEREWRQLVREHLPAGKAQDAQDLALAFNPSNQRSWANVLRAAALDWVLQNMPQRFIVRPGFVEELFAYYEGRGELPDDAAAIRGEEQLARRFKRAVQGTGLVDVGVRTFDVSGRPREEVSAEIAGRAHEGKPDEDGRYPGQAPRGRFARAGDPDFEPDSR